MLLMYSGRITPPSTARRVFLPVDNSDIRFQSDRLHITAIHAVLVMSRLPALQTGNLLTGLEPVRELRMKHSTRPEQRYMPGSQVAQLQRGQCRK